MARILRWGTLMGGLAIIVDLGTQVLQQRLVGTSEPDGVLFYADLVLSAIFYSLAGRMVARETGGIAFGAIAGLLAGILDGLVVGLAQDLSVASQSAEQSLMLSLLTENALLGFVLAGASAFFALAGQRRPSGPGRR